MTVDLLQVLPDFDTRPYSHLLPSLDKALITTNDLITLDATDVAKRASVPTADLRRLVEAILVALHRQLGLGDEEPRHDAYLSSTAAGNDETRAWKTISTLDERLDAALGGGIPPGYLIEVTGESGAGKTQLLLTLLLSSQLPEPRGLAKAAIYISTEAPLATTRLTQLLSTHPSLSSLPANKKPSLGRILSIQTPDLETQEHIIRYQLPVAISRHGIGLVVIDSVAANYRAEFEKGGTKGGPRNGAASMARRGAQLVQLGALLRDIARTEGIAIVAANQVSDRFTVHSAAHSAPASNVVSRTTSNNSQPGDILMHSQSTAKPSQGIESAMISPDPLALDHQQRWFTGWGEERPSIHSPAQNLKTPSLGLVWTNQISCRIALIKDPVYTIRAQTQSVTQIIAQTISGEEAFVDREKEIKKWRRWLKVVFAPWVEPTEGKGVEYEVLGSGLKHVDMED